MLQVVSLHAVVHACFGVVPLLNLENADVEVCSLPDLIVAIGETLFQQQDDVGPQRRNLVSEGSKRADSSSADHRLLEIYAVVNESDVARGVLGHGSFLCQEVQYLRLNMRMFTVFNVLSQDH